MRWYKVVALIFRDFIIFTRSRWRLVEFFYFPVTTVIIWGFFALYTREFARSAGLMVLVINVFWSFSYICQSTINLQMNEDIWSGSLKQVLASGISEFEYILARIVSSAVISIIIMFIMLVVTCFFGFSIKGKFNTILHLTGITLIGSVALSVVIAAFIIFLGRDYAFLAWTILQLFVLLSAPLFPVDILPAPLQWLAQVMPFTRVFAAVRKLVSEGSVASSLLVDALEIVLVYLALSFPLYFLAFRRARKVGKLARMT